MLGYLERSMHIFHHKTPKQLEDQLYQHVPPNYGAQNQYTEL